MIPVTVLGVYAEGPRIIHLPGVPRAGDFVTIPGYIEEVEVDTVTWFNDPVADGALTHVALLMVGF
jgi:hypothetical protein